ncbi:MAG: hypothetical protein ACOY3K_05945 [Candidatus Omnitrophota bacterium]
MAMKEDSTGPGPKGFWKKFFSAKRSQTSPDCSENAPLQNEWERFHSELDLIQGLFEAILKEGRSNARFYERWVAESQGTLDRALQHLQKGFSDAPVPGTGPSSGQDPIQALNLWQKLEVLRRLFRNSVLTAELYAAAAVKKENAREMQQHEHLLLIRDLRRQLEEIKQRTEEELAAERETSSLRAASYEKIRSEKEALESTLERSAREKEDLCAERQRLQACLIEAEDALATLTREGERIKMTLERQFAGACEQAGQWKRETERLEQKLAGLQAERAGAETQLQEIRTQKSALEASIAERERDFGELTRTLEKVREEFAVELRTVREEVESWKTQNERLKELLSVVEADRTQQLEAQKGFFEKEIQHGAKRLEAALNLLAAREKEYLQMTIASRDMQSALKAEMEAGELERKALQETVRSLETANRAELEGLSARYEEALQEKERRIEDLRLKIEEIDQRALAIEGERARLKIDRDRLFEEKTAIETGSAKAEATHREALEMSERRIHELEEEVGFASQKLEWMQRDRKELEGALEELEQAKKELGEDLACIRDRYEQGVREHEREKAELEGRVREEVEARSREAEARERIEETNAGLQMRINSYETEIWTLQEQIKDLHRRLEEMEAAKGSLEGLQKDLEMRRAELEGALGREREAGDELRRRKDELENWIAALEKERAESEKTRQELESMRDQYAEEVKDKQQTIELILAEKRNVEEERAVFQEQLASAEREREQLKLAIGSLATASHAELEGLRARYEEALAEKDRLTESLRAQIAEFEGRYRAAEAERNQYRAEKEQLLEAKQKAEEAAACVESAQKEERDAWGQRVRELEEEIGGAFQKMEMLDRDRRGLESAVEELETAKAELEQGLAAVRERHDAMAHQHAAERQSFEEAKAGLETRVRSYEAQVLDLESQVAQKVQRIRELDTQQGALETLRRDLVLRLAELEKTLDHERAEGTQLRARCEELEKWISALEREKAESEPIRRGLEAARDRYETELRDMKQTIEGLSAEKRTREEERAVLKERLEVAERERESLDRAMESFTSATRQELEELRGRYEAALKEKENLEASLGAQLEEFRRRYAGAEQERVHLQAELERVLAEKREAEAGRNRLESGWKEERGILDHRIHVLEEEIETTLQKLELIKQDRCEMEIMLEELEASKGGLERDLAVVREQLNETVRTHAVEKAGLEGKLQEETVMRRRLEETITELGTALTELRERHETGTRHYDLEKKEMEKQVEEALRGQGRESEIRKQLEETHAGMEVRLRGYEFEVKSLKEELSVMTRRLEELDAERRTLESLRQEIEAKKAGLEQALSHEREEGASVRRRKEELEGWVSILEKERGEAEGMRREIETVRSRYENEIKEKQGALERALLEKGRIEEEAKLEKEKDLAEILRWKKVAESISEEMVEFEAERRNHFARYQALEEEKKALAHALEESRGQLERVRLEVDRDRVSFETALRHKDEELQSWKQAKENYEKQIGSLEQDKHYIEALRKDLEFKKEAFETLIRQKDDFIERLREEKEMLQRDHREAAEQSRQEMLRWKAEADRLSEKLLRIEKDHADFEQARREWEDRKTQFEHLLEVKQREYFEIMENRNRLQETIEKELKTNQEEVEIWRSEAEKLRRELLEVVGDKRELESVRNHLEGQKRALEELWEAKRREYEQKIAQEEKARSEAGEEARRLSQEVGGWKQKASLYEKQAADFKKRFLEIESYHGEMRQVFKELEFQKKEIERALWSKQDELEKSRQSRQLNETGMTREYEKLVKEAAELKEKWAKVDRRIHDLESEKQAMQASLSEERRQLENWQRQHQEAAARARELEQKLVVADRRVSTDMTREAEALKQKCAELEEKLSLGRELFVRRLTVCADEIDHWKQEAAKSRREVEYLKKHLFSSAEGLPPNLPEPPFQDPRPAGRSSDEILQDFLQKDEKKLGEKKPKTEHPADPSGAISDLKLFE